MSDAEWEAAAQAAAERIRAERALSDRCTFRSSFSGPVVCFGDVHVPVGPGTDVPTPDHLYAELDEAVAWYRLAGPGRWLARDQAQVDEMWAVATASLDAYNRVGSLLAVDLARTTGLASTWTVEVTPKTHPFVCPLEWRAQPRHKSWCGWRTDPWEEGATACHPWKD